MQRPVTKARIIGVFPMSAVFKRYASTKIPVQLLKDFSGLGYKGEIVQVPPGRMRNELHVNNGAAYVLKGEPLRIPLKTRESIEAEKAELAARVVKQKEEKRAKDRIARQEREKSDRAERVKRLTNLQFGSNVSAAQESLEPESNIGASAFIVESALRSLPKTIHIQRETKGEDDGFLMADFTINDLAQHVTRLTGTQVSASIVKFSVKTGRKDYTDTSLIDYIGSYRAVFSVPGGHPVFFDITVSPSNKISNTVSSSRPGGPIPESSQLPSEKGPEQQTSPVTQSKTKNSRSKNFEWENELITNMEEDIKR